MRDPSICLAARDGLQFCLDFAAAHYARTDCGQDLCLNRLEFPLGSCDVGHGRLLQVFSMRFLFLPSDVVYRPVASRRDFIDNLLELPDVAFPWELLKRLNYFLIESRGPT